MNQTESIELAQFTPQRQTGDAETIRVHFNPVSLQLSVTNTIKDPGEGNNNKQFVTQSTAKLSMDLVFDTTDKGEDVRSLTQKVASYMNPDEEDGKKIPAIVLFEWGTYKFQGMVESYKETIDFFAPGGVPLRASVNLTLSKQDQVFEPSQTSSFDTQGSLASEPIVLPTTPGGEGAAGVTKLAKNERAARAVGAANSQASLRFAAGPGLAIGGAVPLRPPTAFASGNTANSFELGGAVSGRSSAGVPANAGSFSGLRLSAKNKGQRSRIETSRLLPKIQSTDLDTDRGATFRIGGRASVKGSGSLKADVGSSAHLRARIQFDEE